MSSLKLQNGRFVFIDVFRAISIFMMLQGHTFRALLDPTLRTSDLFSLHEFIHGLTAPSFLVAAGLTFGISTFRHPEQYSERTSSLYKRIGKFLLLILIGYTLHIPYFSFKQFITQATYADFRNFAQVDVLQCVGATLLFSQALFFLLKERKKFIYVVAAIAIGTLFITPFLQNDSILNSLPLIVSQYASIYNGSNFPLFPNAFFILAGIILSDYFLSLSETEDFTRFFKRMFWGGLLLAVWATVSFLIPVQIYPVSDFWRLSPNFLLVKLGIVMIMLVVAWLITSQIRNIPSALPTLGKESLFIYVVHVPIIYGSAVSYQNLQMILGTHLNEWQATLTFVCLSLFVCSAAIGWNAMKNYRIGIIHRTVQIGMATSFLYFFFTL